MDYTPGILSLTGANGSRIPSTEARQLALYVTIYSPIQMAADLPENYEKHLEAFQFIRDVPVDWDESIGLAGEVGDYVAIARKQRGSPDWFLGALTDENARTLTLKLDFLDPKARYEAQIYRDGPEASWDRRPYDLVVEKRPVTATDTLELELATSGGAAVRFKQIR
jgi:alpha-glucosidase